MEFMKNRWPKLGDFSPLNASEYYLLGDLIFSKSKGKNRIFDKKDNCFQISINKMSLIVGRRTSVQRLFKKLEIRNLLKTVTDNSGQDKLMLCPQFRSFMHVQERKIHEAMFRFQSFVIAKKYIDYSFSHGYFFSYSDFENLSETTDYETGEIKIIPKINGKKITQYDYQKKEQYLNPKLKGRVTNKFHFEDDMEDRNYM